MNYHPGRSHAINEETSQAGDLKLTPLEGSAEDTIVSSPLFDRPPTPLGEGLGGDWEGEGPV
jgi:hypothetical protein